MDNELLSLKLLDFIIHRCQVLEASTSAKKVEAKSYPNVKRSSCADPLTNNTDKEVASKAIPPSSVLATHASGLSKQTSHAFDCDCARLRQRRLAQDVSSFVGLRIASKLHIQEICGSSWFRNASIKCLDFQRQWHGNLVQSRG